MNGFEPRRPTLAAAGILTLWVAILALPMLTGQWLAAPWGDQYAAGYAFRSWGAEQWRALGHPPLWNPMLFGGLPFIGAGHGDIFYPTSFLRLVLPVDTVVNLGFVLHYIAAGLLTYAWLRKLGVSWTGSVVGGLAYQLSGIIASLASPGHDGKLFASTAFPLALLALVIALRDRRWVGYPLLALSVGLAILGHFQLAYYFCVAIALFALYLAFWDRPRTEPIPAIAGRLGIALAAVLVGFGLTAVQIMPFFAYIPYSPRAEAYSPELGYAAAASYAIPWNHVPEFLFAGFVGAADTYWGSNPLKLHSEYLGLPVIALAILGAMDRGRRRLVWWLVGIGLLFLLVSMGSATPFYQLWWAVMPLMKKVRGAGMAFFIPAFVIATLAAFGVQRLERREGEKHSTAWLAAAGVLALLAATGLLAAMAQSLAIGIEAQLGKPAVAMARAARSAITLGALGSAVALALVGGLSLAWFKNRLKAGQLALLLALVVGADLWRNAKGFWIYTRAHQELYRPDPITERLTTNALPYRVLDLGVYPGDGVALMALNIPQLLGHHGNELHRFDELLGGKNIWRHLSTQILDLFAVSYVIGPAGPGAPDSLPGYRRVLDGVMTSARAPARLFEAVSPTPYARVVPAAAKVPDSLIVPTLLDRSYPGFDRVVLLAPDAPVQPPAFSEAPPPGRSKATVTNWTAGGMTIALDPAPEQPSYVLVAENWYPDWRAAVDGTPVEILRGDYTLITVPVPAGARTVELTFRSPEYARGKVLSIACLVMVLIAFAAGPVRARLGRRGG